MKPDIHPELTEATVTCVCGNVFQTISSKPQMRVEVCSKCHPFFTGQRKYVDTEGRVEKFRQKYGLNS
ncbi:TPA: 50S ribosomal protein L31 [Candidatus Poribacteria bacterium]|nr:50S ribosomal protein L31 [Candidatus Poribacteria bacterium]